MTHYAVQWTYTDDTAKVDGARSPHVDYLKQLLADEVLLAAGGWADGKGGLVIFDVADRSELAPLLDNDPFTTAGVIVSTEIHEWKIALGSVGS
jgi:uncharacterized protein YciI